MKHPEKWRETCDPFALPYRHFQPQKVLGYPHAGNDVFHMRGVWRERELTAYVKVTRKSPAGIKNEGTILPQVLSPLTPRVLDWGVGDPAFLVTEELPGQRLSVLTGENRSMESLAYLEIYGRTLSEIHGWHPEAGSVPDRKFLQPPSEETLKRLGLSDLNDFFRVKPENEHIVFCHGDFHYANVLWQDYQISGILDFELSGYGNRDFDIAWALFVRPGQKFLKTQGEQVEFLRGYAQQGKYDPYAVRYYMAQCYVHFLDICGADEVYSGYVRRWLRELGTDFGLVIPQKTPEPNP